VETPPSERLVVGLVRGLNGLRGTVRVEVLTDHADRFGRGSVLYPEGSTEPLTVTWSQGDGPALLLRFRELPTRVEAEALRGVYLEAASQPAALPPDTWYWHEIIGCTVATVGGEALGSVTDIFRTGGSEVYVVSGGPRGELLIPAVSSVVRELSPDAGRIVVDADALGLPAAVPVKKPRGRLTTRGRRRGDGAAGAGAPDAAAAHEPDVAAGNEPDPAAESPVGPAPEGDPEAAGS
jgi:16S rRNA processing protein RimM